MSRSRPRNTRADPRPDGPGRGLKATGGPPDGTPVARPRIASLVLAGALLSVPASVARAAPGDTVRHAASVTGHIATESSQVLPAWTPCAAVATTYLRRIGGDESKPLRVDARLQSNLLVAFGIADHAQLDLSLPMILHQRGTTYEAGRFVTLPGAALGDLRVGARGTILRTPRRGFGLGVGFDVTAPTGDRSALTTLGGPTYTPSALAEYRGVRGITLAANLGYAVRPEVNLASEIGGDAVEYRLAARVPVSPREAFALFAELDGSASMVRGADSPLALRGGFRWSTRGGLVMNLWGGGAIVETLGLPTMQLGLSAGFAPVSRMRTEPAFEGNERPGAVALARAHDRALLASADAGPPSAPPARDDPDGDGVLASADRCPSVPEDLDGTDDADGCPELDDDRDGLPDVVDLCPLAPEVVNGYRDLDGCPDRRLADGGETFDTFDPRRLLPALHFARGSAQLDATLDAQLDEVAELLRLNPWIERLQVAVYVPATKHPDADRDLADARARALRSALAARGVDAWRVETLPAKTIPEGTAERVRLTLSGRARALDPVAPRPETLDRIIAEGRLDDEAEPETMQAQGPPTQPGSPR